MSEQMFHTPLEPNISSSIYPPLFSVNKSDHYNDTSHDQVVYNKEQKLGYYNTGWIFSLYYNSKNYSYQERFRAKPTSKTSEKVSVGANKLSW